MRSVAKLCLNSFWGKFGQRENLPSTEIISERESLLRLLTDDEKEVLRVLPINDELLYATWQYKDVATLPSSQTNVAIAAYTTAQARLELYSYLERLDRRVLYYDTDSVVFVSTGQVGEWNPPLGSLLGDMTNELSKYDTGYIDSFVSGGPKFYGYTVVKPENPDEIVDYCCKVKGLRLNYENSQIVNFDSIKQLITTELPKDNNASIRLEFSSIRRTIQHDVITRKETKTCNVVCEKRRHVTHKLSYPYGFIE